MLFCLFVCFVFYTVIVHGYNLAAVMVKNWRSRVTWLPEIVDGYQWFSLLSWLSVVISMVTRDCRCSSPVVFYDYHAEAVHGYQRL